MNLETCNVLLPARIHRDSILRLIYLCLALVTCFDVTARTPRIIGGDPASIGEFPFLVQVFPSSFLCGGSLIADNWVLTAAHCVINESGQPYAPSEISIRAGTNTLQSGGETASVSAVVVHPSFNDNTYDNDIALLQLAQSVTAHDTGTISWFNSTLENSELFDGSALTVAGWGTTESASISTNLLKAEVELSYPQTCRLKSDYVPNWITDNMICAGIDGGGKDACQGDSGGPLFRYLGEGNYRLAGIVSWGVGCAQTGYPGVYTRIANFTGWITSHTGIAVSSPKPEPPALLASEATMSGTELTFTYPQSFGLSLSFSVNCSDEDGQIFSSEGSNHVVIEGLEADVTYSCFATATSAGGTSGESAAFEVIGGYIPSGLPPWLLYQASQN